MLLTIFRSISIMKLLSSLTAILLFLISCSEKGAKVSTNSPGEEILNMDVGSSDDVMNNGDRWRLAIQITDEEIPFDLRLQYDNSDALVSATILNGEEFVEIPGFSLEGDSLFLPFPVFDSEIKVALKGDELNGIWYNDARRNKNRLAVRGIRSTDDHPRITETSEDPPADFAGKWEVEFVYQETEKSKAIGIFEQDGDNLKGTFRTETGDYRYLAGSVYGNEMKLSTFDGAHAFLFHARKLSDGSLEGTFWSGDHWIETWTATLNPDFSLTNPDSLTYLKEGESTVEFSFINSEQHLISPSDTRYQDKALLVQIMGTWCPNCKDQTTWLNEVYATYKPKGLEVISLAFELTEDTAIAFTNINKLKDYFHAPYEILFAGRAGKKTASAALPQLNHVMSYPTLIFMDRNHTVQRIYTGFNGPATGPVYEKLVESFDQTIRQLLESV